MKKVVLGAAVAMALGSSAAHALSINITTFESYDAGGNLASTSSAVTNNLFNSALGGVVKEPFIFDPWWTGYQVMWDDTVTGSSVNWSGTTSSGSYNYDYTLNTGEVVVGLMFNLNWSGVYDIAILQIFDCSDNVNCIGVNNDINHWDVPGSEMTNGPFIGQHFTFSGLVAVPVPAAIWLFSSGFVVLIGLASRKKA